MFTFDTIDFQRLAVSSVGALALSAACIGAAVAPARAASAPVTAEAWQQSVERQLETNQDRYSLRMDSGKRAEAVLAVRFTPEGDYAGADIARSSGNASLDKHAVKVADEIKYPRLPDAMRGKTQTVAMRIFFGRADTAMQLAEMRRDLNDVKLAAAAGSNDQIAVK